MMLQYVQKKLFEDQLLFSMRDGPEDSTVFIGSTQFAPSEVLRSFHTAYQHEMRSWMNEIWTPMQSDIRDEVLRYHANEDRYTDLKGRMRQEQVIPLVGSGMSVASGLPIWSEFLLKIASFTQCSLPDLRLLISSSCFEEAADLIESATNPRLLGERITHNLRVLDSNDIDGPILLLPGLFSDVVLTTNLDNILELLYSICDIAFTHVLNGRDIPRYRELREPRAKILLKLHGDHRDQDERVLLSSEYDEAYAEGSALRDEVGLICRNNSLLFLGCSLGPDRTIGLIEEASAADERMPNHYTFLPKPDSESNLIDREHFLTERGIFPIWYDLPHDDAIMALLDGLHLDVGQ